MKTQTVRSNNDIKLAGITADARFVGDTLQEIVLTDTQGNFLIVNQNAYSFQALVKAQPKTAKKFKLEGSVLGLAVDETFDTKFEAETRRDQLSDYGRADYGLTLTESIEVVVED